MGVEIVKAAVVHGRHLSGNAYKVLVAMSLSALDKPSNGRTRGLYWGGWDGLAITLGHEHAERNSSGHKAVKRAIKELRDAGHISPMLDAHRGMAQSYSVHPGGPEKGAQNDPVKGGHSDPVKGGQSGPQSGPKMTPPRKELGSSQDLSEDIQLISQGDLQSGAGFDKPHGFQGRPGDDCTECGQSHLNLTIHPRRLRAVR